MQTPTLSKQCLALGTVVILASWGSGPARGTEANFWIANNANGPQAPVIEVLADSSPSFDIWARPEPGMTLGGFSLNLVSTTPNTIAFQSVAVLNPMLPARNTRRHQLVFDSNTTWTVFVPDPLGEGGTNVVRTYNEDHLQDALIESFFGGTFVNDSNLANNGVGIGPDCAGDSQYCQLIGGEPAWKVATVDFDASDSLGATELYLEIGEHGIWHLGETSAATAALFGDPSDQHAGDLHTWTPASTGGHTGLPDAVIHVVSQFSNADFNGSGRVDGADHLIWQRGFDAGTSNSEGDANFDGIVNEPDLQIWESQYGNISTPLLVAVPEPSAVALQMLALGLLGLGVHRMHEV